MTLADDLMLLAVHPAKHRIRSPERLPFALRVAELAELALAGRVVMSGKRRRIEVVDGSRVADRHLSGTLRVLSDRQQPPTLTEWLRETPRGLANEYASRLTDQKSLRVSRSRGRDGRTRTEVLWADTERRRAVKARIDAVTRGRTGASLRPAGLDEPAGLNERGERGELAEPGGFGEERDRTLAALVHVSGLGPHLYGPLLGWPRRRRLAALVAGDEDTADTADTAAGTFTGGAALGEAVRTAREFLADLPGAYADTTSYLLGGAHGPFTDGPSHDIGGHHQT